MDEWGWPSRPRVPDTALWEAVYLRALADARDAAEELREPAAAEVLADLIGRYPERNDRQIELAILGTGD